MFEGLQAIRKEIEESVNTIQDKEEIHDGFQLRFVGKSYAKFVTGLPTETVLVPDNDWNNQDANKNSQNIFITGDNLDALKHLVNAYTGAIKMIYIDPPYNTGSDGFVYKDTFKFSDSDLKQKLGFTDTELARLRALDGKCSHSAWLTFMLPRLVLAKRLLSEDGSIFISIDDNEQANLKVLCDEIFGADNFVYSLSVVDKLNGNDNSSGMMETQEYCLIYAKNKNTFSIGVLPLEEDSVNEWQRDELGFWKEGGGIKATGVAAKREDRPNLYYPLYINENTLEFRLEPNEKFTYELFPKINGEDGRWTWQKEKFISDANEVIIKKVKEGYSVYKKQRPSLGELPSKRGKTTFYSASYSTANSSAEIKALFGGKKVFDFTKSSKLVKDFISLSNTSSTGIILDFFAGSATTAHAVMQLNKDDGGNRKYIMVQLDEKVKEGSEAQKQGFRTIDEISRKRIKLAANKIGDTSGFKHYKLAKISDNLILDKIDTFDPTKPNLLSDDMVSPFSGGALGTGLSASGLDTILTTWMVDDGYPLNTCIKEYTFGAYTAYSPADSKRLYLIADGWDSDATKDLLNKIGRNEISVQTIIIYNHSFGFTTLTELKNNLKHVLDEDKKVEVIERF